MEQDEDIWIILKRYKQNHVHSALLLLGLLRKVFKYAITGAIGLLNINQVSFSLYRSKIFFNSGIDLWL